MAYRQPPDHSYARFPTLEEYVDNFFALRDKPYTYERDVKPLFKKRIPFTIKGRIVDITGRTFKTWQIKYNEECETNKNQTN
jgi:hypothetical protein